MDRLEQTDFDIVVYGTGLEECLIAGAAAKSGKSVLHIDSRGSYGSYWSAMESRELEAWLKQQAAAGDEEGAEEQTGDEGGIEGCEERSFGVRSPGGWRRVHSEVEAYEAEEVAGLGVRGWAYDMAPKVVYARGPLVEALLSAGVQDYTEWRLLDGHMVWKEGGMRTVPANRGAVFRDRVLSLVEKNQFFKFITACQKAFAAAEHAGEQEQWGQQPFLQLLQEHALSSYLQDVVLYALAMAPERQQDAAGAMTASAARQALLRQQESQEHHGFGAGPFITNCYGCGDLSQMFCRFAAVHGALYKLNERPRSVFLDRASGAVTGLRLQSGQVVRTRRFAGNCDAFRWASSSPALPKPSRAVSRAVCVTDRSLRDGMANLLLVFPPHSVAHGFPRHPAYALQLSGSSAKVAPSGLYLLHFWTLADAGRSAREDLEPLLEALCSSSDLMPQLLTAREEHSQNADTQLPDSSTVQAEQSPKAGALRPSLRVADGRPGDVDRPPSSSERHVSVQEDACGIEGNRVSRAADDDAPGSRHRGEADRLVADISEGLPPCTAVMKPRILRLLLHRQVLGNGLASDSDVPGNAVCCQLPDHTASYVTALSSAETAFMKLFGTEAAQDAAVRFYPPTAQANDSSDGESEEGL